MRIEIKGWTVKIAASKRGFQLDIDSPDDKKLRSLQRLEMERVKRKLHAVGE